MLFVDDEPQERAAFLRLANARGLKAQTAATGEEAIGLAQGEHYDFVVTDLSMPGMSGAQLLKHLIPILPAARFVIVTGSPIAEFSSDPATERRVLGVFRKPWNSNRLFGALANGGRRPAARSQSEPPEPERALNVLVVEDDLDHLKLLEVAIRKCQSAPHRLEHVACVAEARERLSRDDAYDIILADLGLPDSRGLETLVLLRATSPRTPIVVLTGGGNDSLATQALRMGAQDYLYKESIRGPNLNRSLRFAVERGQVERRMLEMARTDPLTGLGNRTLFRERVTLALARARRSEQPLALLYLDLDKFKRINDTLGHDAGDSLLLETGRRLLQNVREYDTVARFGGDEFAVLLEGLQDDAHVALLVERLLVALRQPLQLGASRVNTSASIGIALFPQCRTTDELLEAADTALYQSKRQGRDRLSFFDARMQDASRQRLAMDSDLLEAYRNEQFRLVYQKQVCLQDGRLLGVEALLRWEHDGETVGPDNFVPALEESGLILEVGSWVLDESLRQLAEWHLSGVPIPKVAVNVSARQFSQAAFPELVIHTLEKHSIPPTALELELTEAVLVNDMTMAKQTAHTLHELGVRLAIDDLGTGFSSLSNLVEIPLDVLKLDRCFVSNLRAGAPHPPIVRAVMAVAKSLNLDVVAEGLERREQQELLLGLGCRFAQGFYYHRPEAAAALTSQLAAGTAKAG